MVADLYSGKYCMRVDNGKTRVPVRLAGILDANPSMRRRYEVRFGKQYRYIVVKPEQPEGCRHKGAHPVKAHGGRMYIPPAFRNYAGISRDVAFLGVGRRLEIWDKETWQEYDDIMQRLGRITSSD